MAYLKIMMRDKTGMPAEQLNIVFPADKANKPLANDQILSSVGIVNGSRVGSSLMMRGSTPAEKEEWTKWHSQFKDGRRIA